MLSDISSDGIRWYATFWYDDASKTISYEKSVYEKQTYLTLVKYALWIRTWIKKYLVNFNY